MKKDIAEIHIAQYGLRELLFKISNQLESRQCGTNNEDDFGDVEASESRISAPLVEALVPLIQETNVLPPLGISVAEQQPLPRFVLECIGGIFGDIVPSDPLVSIVILQGGVPKAPLGIKMFQH